MCWHSTFRTPGTFSTLEDAYMAWGLHAYIAIDSHPLKVRGSWSGDTLDFLFLDNGGFLIPFISFFVCFTMTFGRISRGTGGRSCIESSGQENESKQGVCFWLIQLISYLNDDMKGSQQTCDCGLCRHACSKQHSERSSR